MGPASWWPHPGQHECTWEAQINFDPNVDTDKLRQLMRLHGDDSKTTLAEITDWFDGGWYTKVWVPHDKKGTGI